MVERVFYVVYFSERRLQATLDAMRFIANPREKFQAHITVRGPYAQLYNLHRQQRKIFGAEVVADGVGAFFDENQHTVFIQCHSTRLREVWKKPDFEFNPHITIYDGSSRQFATVLLSKLEEIAIQFRFLIDEMEPLKSVKGQSGSWLRNSFDEDFARDVIGWPIRAMDIENLSEEMRIFLIVQFARNLSKYSTAARDTSLGTLDQGGEV